MQNVQKGFLISFMFFLTEDAFVSDTEAVEFHWEEAGHGKVNDSDTDCWKFLFTS